ncbi:MAG: TIGR04283 family arsenosugar biosynthesis glycosyltransferase [Thiobacillus sp.]|nr:TIGR04283 family arsenosugar biosynthesis glycosyltransferase [Thiobacillus sp.]
MSMRISVVIPALDEAAQIGAVLQRLQAMRARGAEVIVVDGGSGDATVAIAEPLADSVVGAPRGRARQMNAGAAAASGDVLLFLHADTLLPTDADLQIRAGLESGARVWGRFDVRIAGRARILRVVAAMMNLRSRLTGIASGDQALFVTRAAFDAAGCFPDQELMEDIELSRRLLHLSRPLCLAGPALTSGRRWEARGVWRTIFLMWRLRWLYARGESPARLAARYR